MGRNRHFEISFGHLKINMAFNLKKGGDFVLCPAGTFVARCFMIVDLGMQPNIFQGKEKSPRQMIRIGFEFPTEQHVFKEEVGKEPFTLSKRMTNSLGAKSTMKPFLTGWRGREFSAEEIKTFTFDKLIGAPALITVVHEKKADGGLVAKIQSVSKLPPMIAGQKVTCPPAIIKPVIYSVDSGEDATFNSLSKWIQEECRQCLEWTEAPEDEGQPGQPSGGSIPPDAGGSEEDNSPF